MVKPSVNGAGGNTCKVISRHFPNIHSHDGEQFAPSPKSADWARALGRWQLATTYCMAGEMKTCHANGRNLPYALFLSTGRKDHKWAKEQLQFKSFTRSNTQTQSMYGRILCHLLFTKGSLSRHAEFHLEWLMWWSKVTLTLRAKKRYWCFISVCQ